MELEEEYKQIQRDFEAVLRYSQGYKTDINATNVMVQWRRAKDRFIRKFGGLTYTFPEKVEIELTASEAEYLFNKFRKELLDLTWNDDTIEFIDKNKAGFFDNKIVKMTYAAEKTKKIHLNDKLSKAIKYFEPKENVEDIQNLMSRYIQQKKVTGYYCLSVHPLDFLSASENNYKWRSCHALNGEYAMGNLSLMVDEVTFICYLKSDQDTQLRRFPKGLLWNNKKWRMFAHLTLNENCIWYSKEYPFSCSKLVDKCHDKKSPLEDFMAFSQIGFERVIVKNDSRGNYGVIDKDYISNTNLYHTEFVGKHYIIINHKIHETSEFVKEGYEALNYNDILHSSSYTPRISLNWKAYYSMLSDKEELSITIGGPVQTLCGHGGYMDWDEENEAIIPFCDECYSQEPIYYCSYCGDRIIPNVDMVEHGSSVYCKDCYDYLVSAGEID